MARLKMKELERATGVGRETIRYYIREGLLPEPQRPSRNVAWYDESFVERIALIKELQEKRYLPLQVIKAILDSDTPPSPDQALALGQLDGKLFAGPVSEQVRKPARLSEVADRCRLPAAEIVRLEELGVVEIETRDGDRWLDDTSIRIVELWSEIRRAGFTDELGFGPERLKVYVAFVSLLTREELRLFGQRITGKVDAETSARMGEIAIENVNQIIGLLRKTAILKTIRELGLPGQRRRHTGSEDA